MVPVVTALLLVPSGRSGLAVSMWPCSFFFFFGLLAGDCLWKQPSALALICKVGHVWLSSNPTCVALSSNPTWCCFSCFFFFGFQAGLICFRIQHAQLLGRKALVVGYVWLRKKKNTVFRSRLFGSSTLPLTREVVLPVGGARSFLEADG